MQLITNAQTGAVLPARPEVATKVKSGTRLAYIDVTRGILTILVMMVHTAITYGAFGDWTYHDLTTSGDELASILLSLFVFVCQSFFMGLFFFFSGYFTPGSYDRKGTARFWNDRLLRLAIPMVIYTYFLSRVPNYINAVANNGLTSSFWQFSSQTFLTQSDAGPTWFLFALLVFSLGYTLWRIAVKYLRIELAWASRLPAPDTKVLLALALVIGAAMFAIAQINPIDRSYRFTGAYNLLLAFFPGYILLFIGGALAYRNQWLSSISGSMLRFWAWLSGALIIALPAFLIAGGAIDGGMDPFLSSPTWQCACTCLWMGLACIAFSATLTLWLRDRVMPQTKISAFAGPNSFTAYLIHPLILVPLTYGMSFIALPALVKFGLASTFTVILSYGVANGLRRLPGAKAIL